MTNRPQDNYMRNILVTGGAGFIGSNFCHMLSKKDDINIFVVDNLTYAANIANIKEVKRCKFFKSDIGNKDFISNILIENKIDAIVNFAAETHVDNSIDGPGIFIQTNILSTYHLLQTAIDYQSNHNDKFRFVHVSTDEVFGDLQLDDPKFNENTPYKPSSPYSASKAASDHLVHAWHRTYGLNAVITNCTNNYGRFQFPEKLIPKTIIACLNKQPITIYGNGMNIRDWIYVDDHCYGVYLALTKGKAGESYCFGGDNEINTLQIVHTICDIMNKLHPQNEKYENLITFVEDRKGHDFRYAIDDTKAQKDLGFTRTVVFEQGIIKTIEWYIEKYKKMK